jgi:Family of unknown function (DUF6624)
LALQPGNYDSIKIELEIIQIESLTLRGLVGPTVRKYGYDSEEMDSLFNKMNCFDSSSLVYVEKVISGHGWLGKSTIGESANTTLFLTVQHSDLETIEKYFPLLQKSAESKESRKSDMAKMKDRILVLTGEKQVYGTQFHMVNGKSERYPIEDEKNLNKRRRKVGLKKIK